MGAPNSKNVFPAEEKPEFFAASYVIVYQRVSKTCPFHAEGKHKSWYSTRSHGFTDDQFQIFRRKFWDRIDGLTPTKTSIPKNQGHQWEPQCFFVCLKIHGPSNSKWPCDPLVGDRLNLTIPKRSAAELPGIFLHQQIHTFSLEVKDY